MSAPLLDPEGISGESVLVTLRRIASEYKSRLKHCEDLVSEMTGAIEKVRAQLASVEHAILLEESSPAFVKQMQFFLQQDGANQLTGLNTEEPPETEEGKPASEASFQSRQLSARWLAFVEQRLYELGPTTVDALYAEAPDELRAGFEAVKSVHPPLFRARRSLRKSPVFEVDRSTGMVTMLASPSPSLKPYSENDPVVIGAVFDPKEKQHDLVMIWKGDETRYPYRRFKNALREGSKAWMRDSDGALIPLAIKKTMNRKSKVSSYDEVDWTDAFAKLLERSALSPVSEQRIA